MAEPVPVTRGHIRLRPLAGRELRRLCAQGPRRGLSLARRSGGCSRPVLSM